MEDLSKKRKLDVLARSMPEGVPFGFPLRRRSHLKSETFSTLVRIFSLCVNESEAAQDLPIVSDAPDPGTRSEKSLTENNPVTNHRAEVIDIEPSTSSLGKDISVHSVALLDRNDDNLGVSQIVVEESFQGAEDMEINEQSFSFEIMEATQPTEDMEIDKQLNGVILEESTQVEDTQAPSLSLVQNVMDELANEIQQKETNLNKPVNMETNREVEDGEIPDDSWDTDLSFDMFLEDAALINEMKLGEDQIPEEHTKQGEFHDVCSDKNQAEVMHSASTSYPVDMVEQKKSDGEFQETRKLQQAYGDDFLLEARKNNKKGDETTRKNNKKGDETKGGFSFPPTYADNLSYPVKTSEKSMTENEGIMSAEMDSKVREKKKRGPRSKEAKANKKKKERKKRATKERQQGVKRLRIQPIIKPKIEKYCEFFLKGRCQKGDACKYSHNTTPLTKSEPCKFLALQSCLKGDNCPFDHQLSKYPCNNFITKGTCHRGDACLFSHKPVEGASPSNISQTDSQSQPQPLSGFTSTRKPHNSKNTSFQNPKNISKETTVRTPMSVGSQDHLDQKLPGRFKPPAQPPKGITLLSFGKSSLNESSNRQQGDILCSKEKGIETRNQEDQNTSSKGITLLSFGKSSLSESSNRQQGDILCSKEKGIETRNQEDQNTSSKGITLLSFGKSSFSESSNRQPGDIPCNKEKGIETRNTSPKGITLFSFGKSSLNESSNQQQGDIPCNKEKGIETRNPENQNTSPKGITRFSFGKLSLNESSNRQQGAIPCNKEKVIETRNPKHQTSEKPQSSNNLLWKSPSTPLPLSRSSNPLRNWLNTNTTDSIQKRLLSTLSFAAKHESETVMGQSKCAPSLIPVEANKPPSDVAEATKTPRSDSSSSSVNVSKELKNASPVLLEFLFASSGNR